MCKYFQLPRSIRRIAHPASGGRIALDTLVSAAHVNVERAIQPY